MGLRSEQGPLAALEWLDKSGLFVPPVSLRDWNEVPRLMEICARPTSKFRSMVAERVHEQWPKDADNLRDGAHAEAAIKWLLRQQKGAPPVVEVELLFEDPDDEGGNTPDLLMLDFAFPGGRPRSPAEIVERMRTPPELVNKLANAFHDKYIDPNEKNPVERLAAELRLGADALLLAQVVEDARPRAGRIGYVELVPDVDWPTWKPVEKATALLAAVDDLWPKKCGTYEELAKELGKLGHATLSGKPFTKASVVKVLIAARLVAGSDPPWK